MSNISSTVLEQWFLLYSINTSLHPFSGIFYNSVIERCLQCVQKSILFFRQKITWRKSKFCKNEARGKLRSSKLTSFRQLLGTDNVHGYYSVNDIHQGSNLRPTTIKLQETFWEPSYRTKFT